MAELEPGTTLADRPGFAGLPRPEGEVLSVLYVDGASLRGAIPGAGMSMMAMRMALADVDGFMGALSHEGSNVHFTYGTIVREGSRHLELLESDPRKPDAIDRISSPVLAEVDIAFSAEAFDRAIGGAASFAGASLTFLESELRDELGVDLRADVTENLSGKLGLALLKLPSEPGKNDFGVVGFVGIEDEAAAKSAAERVYAKTHDDIGLGVQQIEGVTVYRLEDKDGEEAFRDPTLQVFVHAGHVWVAIGEVDVKPIIAGPDQPFRKAARHEAIAHAVRKGAHGAGFVDIVELLAAVRPLLSEDDRQELESLSPILSLLEAVTLRADVEGRAIVVRSTLHTSADNGLPTLVQETTKLLGTKLAEQLARAARQQRCAALAEHVVALTRAALSEADADLDTTWEIERKVLEQCEGPKMTDARLDCYLQTTTIDGLVECDAKNPAGGDEGGDEAGDEAGEGGGGEPRPVPYVDDIWPHLSDDPDSAKPQPEVNYGVPLGPDPQQRGPDDALITIVEFGDFQCPYCKRVAPTLDQVLADHGKDVRIVFRHQPLENLHKDARNAAKAAIAAGKQGKFWEMHDRLFAGQHELTEANFRSWAEQIGLDVAQFDRDYYDAETDRQLQADIDTALKFGADGTPAFFVNGRYLGGAQTKAAFDSVIEEEKARALKFIERRGNTRKRLYDDMISHFAPEVLEPRDAIDPIDPDEKRYILSTTGLPQKGASGFGRVQIIECGDFDCPYCARARATIDKVLDAYPSQVSFFFAHHPLQFHHGAEPAARAAVAADNQGKFWEMHDLLFEGQGSSTRTEADFVGYARTLKLDVERFKTDFAAAETAEKVENQRKLCADSDVTATPTFFVNGARIEGAQEFDRFKAIIDAELASGI
jgi:protein-disulfide isomerase